MKTFEQLLSEVRNKKSCPKGGDHNWKMVVANNGDPKFSMTERCDKCKHTRKVNPETGRVQNR